jgi:hypothetical protein
MRDFGDEFGFELYPFGWIYPALEDGILDALAVVFAQSGHTAQAASSGSALGTDIVRDNHKHHGACSGSLPEETRITVEVSSQVARQQRCLHIGHKTERDLLAQKGVYDFFLFSLLPGYKHALARLVIHCDGAGFEAAEAIFGNLLAIDQRQGETIGQNGPQFFDEV